MAADTTKRSKAEQIKSLFTDPYALYLMGQEGKALDMLTQQGKMDPLKRMQFGGMWSILSPTDKERIFTGASADKRAPDIFDELRAHNDDQLDALRKAQEDNTRQTQDYVKAQLDQINQLNAGFTKQMEDMRASQAAEMASVKQQNEATISGLNQSFQNELAMRDKQNAIRAQATNMALLKEKAKNKRGEFGSATLLSNPAAMGGLLLGKTSLLGM